MDAFVGVKIRLAYIIVLFLLLVFLAIIVGISMGKYEEATKKLDDETELIKKEIQKL